MQNRRKFIRQSSLFVSAYAFLKPLEGFTKALKPTNFDIRNQTLSILHTSDLHLTNGNNSNEVYSNLEIIQQRVESFRKSLPNFILLHNGNLGTVSSSLNKNVPNQYITTLENIRYDAMTTGNIDMLHNSFFLKLTNYQPYFNFINSINCIDINKLKILPFHVINRGLLKIGIIANSVSANNNHESIEIKANILSKNALYLKEKQQCNLVICMSTGNMFNKKRKPINNDKEMASLTSHIDIIISGNNNVERPLNQVCKNAKKEEVFIHTSSFDGAAVGRIDITFDDAFFKRSIKGFYREEGYFAVV